jgi:hypothetical protein
MGATYLIYLGIALCDSSNHIATRAAAVKIQNIKTRKGGSIMRKRVSLIVALLMMVMLLAACPASQTGTPTVLQASELTKSVAEDILYYARVYYNLGKLNQAQFDSVVKAYDTLREAQIVMVNARIAYITTPADATAEQKYRAAMTAVLASMQQLINISNQLGLSDPSQAIPIRSPVVK